MDIALIFSKPISSTTAKMFCKTFTSDGCYIKALYMRSGRFNCWTPLYQDDNHCFDFAKEENFIPIYITIL